MTTMDEIKQAFKDYKEMELGGWLFSSPEIYHDADQVHFAQHADGSVEYPNKEETKNGMN